MYAQSPKQLSNHKKYTQRSIRSAPLLQLEEQVGLFLIEANRRSVDASEGSFDGEPAQLPRVEHAAGFERYKVRCG
jgi:hypothetical protein